MHTHNKLHLVDVVALQVWEPKMCRLAWQLLGMLGNSLATPRHAWQRPRHALPWWYTTPLASQLIRQQVGEFFFDVGLLEPCEKACRGRQGRCQACLGVAKQAYTS